MKVKDIVNRDIVNLTNCEQEPIHIPGSIQTHGFLIAMQAQNFIIAYCSGNIEDFVSVTYQQCLGKTFAEVFGKEAQQEFAAYLNKQEFAINPPLELKINDVPFLVTAHETEGMYVAELEHIGDNAPSITSVYNQTIQFVSYMEQSETLQELCSKVAMQTKAITGYDRVMIYRFDKDYNGEVFAEAREEHLEPFLGLHYPHTDIPAQARRLYLTNLMRMITDVGYAPVPIYTIEDGTPKVLDLSKSYLRSVSPIHIEYLQNMGVGGTLTISLIHDGRLWGLITCHHYSPKYVPLYARIAAQMQGYFLTSQINVRQLGEEYTVSNAVNKALERLLEKTQEEDTGYLEKMATSADMLSICNAGGAAILFNGHIYCNGSTPAEEEIRELCSWLEAHTKNDELHTSRLADIYPAAKQFASKGAGIIYRTLSLKGDAVIWFAPETKEEVHWGGDPNNAVIQTDKGLSPRNSFRLWKQILQYESRVWRTPELLAAATFAHALQKHLTLIIVSEEERKQRRLSQQLQDANTELENINWISSHDLKEPLRKIYMFTSRVLDKEADLLSEYTVTSLQKVCRSVDKMQQLLADITEYNKVRHLNSAFEHMHLNDLMHYVSEELKDELQAKNAILNYDALPVVYGAQFMLKQLFINLVRNSLKFSVKEGQCVINIYATSGTVALPDMGDRRYHEVKVADNGIGFDNKHNEAIFKVFSRLHTYDQYEGSGVGLALCRKIMQNHKGFITAVGEPGKGAAFTLHFPVVVADGRGK